MRALPRKTGKGEAVIRRLGFLLLLPVVFFFDRLSKTWLIGHYAEGEGIAVWPGIFHITRVNNTGAAFGIFPNAAVFLILVSFLGVLAAGFYVCRLLSRAWGRGDFPPLEAYAASLIIAGALSNLTDRLSLGYVVDFLDFRVWPVFNIADASICLGVALLAVCFLKKDQ